MKDVIAIIVTILIGIAAKWLEDRNKNKDKRKSKVSHDFRNYPYSSVNSGIDEDAVTNVTSSSVTSFSVSKPKSIQVPAFEEGQCVVPHDDLEDMTGNSDDQVTDDALASHYQRWRQAIIDAQIITPKYKD